MSNIHDSYSCIDNGRRETLGYLNGRVTARSMLLSSLQNAMEDAEDVFDAVTEKGYGVVITGPCSASHVLSR